jgi:predicted AlkP superfamily pyrophosphatase or phosphodiesterase
LDERAWIAKGAEARKLRSLRVGPHQLSKLDILEAEFARAAWSKADLERAASEVAVSVGRFVKQQPQGTLVIVFSDHGMPADGVARGCLPEEVLVPYDAWLVQGVSAFGHSSDRER